MNILFWEWKNFGKEDFIDSCKKSGHEITCITNNHIHDRNNSAFDKLFHEAILSMSYDFVFSFNYSTIISKNCNNHNIKYVSWIYDSPLVSLYSYTIINPCNYIFIFDQALYLDLLKEGIKTVYYLPLAVNIERLDSMIPKEFEKNIFSSDISYIGSMYNEKHNFFERLKDISPFTKGYLDGIMAAQINVNGYFFIEEMLKGDILKDIINAVEYTPDSDGVETPAYIYANYFIARKIAEIERNNLLKKLSNQFQTKLYTHNPTPDLPNIINMGPVDYYDTMPFIFKCSKININISLRSIRSGIPLRAMDILGSGGFLLTNFQSDFLEHFEPNKDFVFFENESDLIDKCNYYLNHEDDRKRIAKNGYLKVKEFHTYDKRIDEIIRIVCQ